MYRKISHEELVQFIAKDCPCPQDAAETIASLLEKDEKDHKRSMVYNPAKLRRSYVYYASAEKAHTELFGAPKEEMSDEEMIRNLNYNGFNVYFPKSRDGGVIIEKEDYIV